MIPRILEIKNDFECKMCGECCRCDIWKIQINHKKMLEMQRVFEETGKAEYASNIIKVQDGKYVFAADDNKRCKFLNEEKMCSIQKEYGAEVMCDVCRTYPRSYAKKNDVIYSSIELSCKHYVGNIEKPLEITEYDGEIKDGYLIASHGDSFESDLYYLLMPYLVDILRFANMGIQEKMKNIIFVCNEVNEIVKKNRKIKKSILFGMVVGFLDQFYANYENGVYNGVMNRVAPAYEKILVNTMEFMGENKILAYLLDVNEIEDLESFLNRDGVCPSVRLETLSKANRWALHEIDALLTNVVVHIVFSAKRMSGNLNYDIGRLIYFYNLIQMLPLILTNSLEPNTIKKYIVKCYKGIYHGDDSLLAMEKLLGKENLSSLYDCVI